jgi:hypothetical protein
VRLLPIIVFLMSLLRCSNKEPNADFAYIKVITSIPADSVTAHNKGFTTGTLLYYEPQKDSIVFYFSTGGELTEDKLYVGHLRNKAYIDTLHNLIRALRKYGNGPLPISTAGGNSTYSGPSYHVEYKDGKGIHNNAFVLMTEDETVYQFDGFYERLIHHAWPRKQVESRVISKDSELVNLSSKDGLYQRLVTPFIIPPCKPGVDLTKLYGVWRSGGMSHRVEDYTKWTFQKDGICIWERVKDGTSTKIAKFNFYTKGHSFTLVKDGKTKTYEIVSLSETCFEYKLKGDDIVDRYGRM